MAVAKNLEALRKRLRRDVQRALQHPALLAYPDVELTQMVGHHAVTRSLRRIIGINIKHSSQVAQRACSSKYAFYSWPA